MIVGDLWNAFLRLCRAVFGWTELERAKSSSPAVGQASIAGENPKSIQWNGSVPPLGRLPVRARYDCTSGHSGWPSYSPFRISEVFPVAVRRRILDRTRLKTQSVRRRRSKVAVRDEARPVAPGSLFSEFLASLPDALGASDLRAVIDAWAAAWKRDRTVIWGFGAHLIKVGLAPVVVDLMERGAISALMAPRSIRSTTTGANPTLIKWAPKPQMTVRSLFHAAAHASITARRSEAPSASGRLARNSENREPGATGRASSRTATLLRRRRTDWVFNRVRSRIRLRTATGKTSEMRNGEYDGHPE